MMSEKHICQHPFCKMCNMTTASTSFSFYPLRNISRLVLVCCFFGASLSLQSLLVVSSRNLNSFKLRFQHFLQISSPSLKEASTHILSHRAQAKLELVLAAKHLHLDKRFLLAGGL